MMKKEYPEGVVKKIYEAKGLHLLFSGKSLYLSHDIAKLKGLEKELEDKYPHEAIHASYVQEIEVFMVE